MACESYIINVNNDVIWYIIDSLANLSDIINVAKRYSLIPSLLSGCDDSNLCNLYSSYYSKC